MEQMQPHREQYTMERDCYIVLLHLYTLTEVAPVLCLAKERLARDLGFREAQTEQLVRTLLETEHLEYRGSSEGLVLTDKGIRYIEAGAGRRRSLRLIR